MLDLAKYVNRSLNSQPRNTRKKRKSGARFRILDLTDFSCFVFVYFAVVKNYKHYRVADLFRVYKFSLGRRVDRPEATDATY